ncbi:MAG: hypothetical protein SFU86_07520 [Pirellulaceae bacterium]|nr:hypothetical protein [Pirellulaceae bacterium]
MESRDILADLAGDILNVAKLVLDTGPDLSRQDRLDLLLLIDAAEKAQKQIGGQK